MMVMKTIMNVSVLVSGAGSRPHRTSPAFPMSYSRYAVRTWGERWCGRGDLNPHAFWAPPPQDGVSANFTTSARITRTRKSVFQQIEGRLKYSKDKRPPQMRARPAQSPGVASQQCVNWEST